MFRLTVSSLLYSITVTFISVGMVSRRDDYRLLAKPLNFGASYLFIYLFTRSYFIHKEMRS